MAGDQSVTFSIEGTRLSIKIGAHCRALIPAPETDELINWLLRETGPMVPNQPNTLTIHAYKTSE